MGKTRSNDHTGVAAMYCDPVRTEKHGSNNCIIRIRSADIRSQNYDSQEEYSIARLFSGC